MELWVPITIAAAFFQNIRSALQKHLTGRLSTGGATQVRFIYAVPFALAYWLVLTQALGFAVPRPGVEFVLYASAGGVAQVVATGFLLASFSYRNFFVGTALSKTEAIQAALIGLVVLADPLTAGAIVGIAIGLVGVLIVSGARSHTRLRDLPGLLTSPAALLGVGAGLFFGLSAICFRGASLSLSGGYLVQAATTLLYTLTLQALLMLVYLRWREPGQMSAVLRNWRPGIWVGLAGMAASVGWFTGVTLQNAGYVRALGQIELVFTFAASVLVFRERVERAEIVGVAAIVTGIVVLLISV